MKYMNLLNYVDIYSFNLALLIYLFFIDRYLSGFNVFLYNSNAENMPFVVV